MRPANLSDDNLTFPPYSHLCVCVVRLCVCVVPRCVCVVRLCVCVVRLCVCVVRLCVCVCVITVSTQCSIRHGCSIRGDHRPLCSAEVEAPDDGQ